MALTATVTPGKTMVSGELLTNSKLNQLAAPTVAITGTADADQITDDSVTAPKAQFGAWFWCSASTASNVITLTASGHAITLVAGMIARFEADATTTGAVDVVFGGATDNLFRYYNDTTSTGVELAAGDIRDGQVVAIVFDGTQWQMLSPIGNSAVVVGTDAGSTDAYAISPSPSVRDYADLTGVPVVFKANTANTGAATLAVSGLAATTIVKSKDVTLDTGDIKAGQWVTVTYDGTNFQLLSPVTSSSARTTVSVRQTVLGCSVDASTGLPNFLATGATTTSVYLQNCTSTPLVVAFAYGHDDSGAVDYVTRISTDGATWTGLGGTTTYYLYVDRNVSTGAITYGITTNRPTYVNTSSVVAGAGFHTYLINTGFMYEGSATSTPVQRVFVGEATTSGGAVASVTAYMPRGEYVSGSDISFTLAASSKTSTHQLGATPRIVRAVFVCQNAVNTYAVGDELDIPISGGYNAGADRFAEFSANATSVSLHYDFASYAPGTMSTAGAATNMVAADWKIRFYAWRGW